MLRIPPLTSLFIGAGAVALIGGGALLAVYVLGRSPTYRPYRRACVAFAGLCGFAEAATLLNFTFPLLNRPPYDNFVNVGWLALSMALSIYLLWGHAECMRRLAS